METVLLARRLNIDQIPVFQQFNLYLQLKALDKIGININMHL